MGRKTLCIQHVSTLPVDRMINILRKLLVGKRRYLFGIAGTWGAGFGVELRRKKVVDVGQQVKHVLNKCQGS